MVSKRVAFMRGWKGNKKYSLKVISRKKDMDVQEIDT